MKQFALLIVLSLVAIGYFVFAWQNQTEQYKPPQPQVAQPDYVASDLKIKLYNQDGKTLASLKADKMEYYANQGLANLKQSEYLLFNQTTNTDWILHANNSQLTDKKRLTLSDNVRLTSVDKSLWLNQFTSQSLALDLNSKQLNTAHPVNASGPNLQVTGNGLTGDLNLKQFELKDNVKTTISPKN